MTDPQDVHIEAWPPVHTGGQHVGRTTSGVKITHLPSGMVAISVSERSQHRNRAIAMDMLLGGLTSVSYTG